MSLLLATLILGALSLGEAAAAEKSVIGAVEEVALLPWNVRLPARVDTGAAGTSLGIEEMQVDGRMVIIRLPAEAGGATLRLPIHRWRRYRTSEGKDRRPVVWMDVCIAGRHVRAEVNLNSRTGMEYPFLVGRNLIANHFVVDVSLQKTAPPVCEDTR